MLLCNVVRSLFLACVFVACVATHAFAASYQSPAKGVIVDAFRAPLNPYGAGNRGWEVAVGPNTEVRAPAGGVVTFAGQVGGTLNIVIQHDDGVRTTLSKLQSIVVGKGDVVEAGQHVGIASGSLYFGARCGQTYVDPRTLFEQRVRLVPLDGVADSSDLATASTVCARRTISSSEAQWLSASRVGDVIRALR